MQQPTRINKSTELAKYFLKAAEQRKLMQPWVDDNDFKSEGGQIIYAVDTDVIVLYTAPEELSMQKGQRAGYAQIFDDDEQSISVALGCSLAGHIFFSFNRR